MNRAELNRIFLNAVSLNRVGSQRGKASAEGGGEIEFTIVDYNGEDRTFKAKEGMTWEEFLNSEYNTEEWYYDGWGILLYSTEGQWMASNYYLYYGGYVQATDTITSSHPYYTSA